MSLASRRPIDPALDRSVQRASAAWPASSIGASSWPAEQLRLCGEPAASTSGSCRATGAGRSGATLDITRGYLRLSAACLTTAFIITQRTGACQRIAGSDNDFAKEQLLPRLVSGESFATVGISHLTTSRRHLAEPVLRAAEDAGGFVLDGYSPWVTGAAARRDDRHRRRAGTTASRFWWPCPPICRASRFRSRRGWSAFRPATPAKSSSTTCVSTAIGCWPGRPRT